MSQIKESQYIKHIAELGDTHKIISHEDIYSKSGIKLVTKNCHINTKIYEHLLSHKLLKPLDESLIIDDCVTPEIIVSIINGMVTNNLLLQGIMSNLDGEDNPINIIASLKIPEALSFKLTVLKNRLNKIFSQGLMVSLTAIYISKQMGINNKDTGTIAFAGIFQNIGMLYLDNTIFEKESTLTNEDRKQIYTHPIIASLILNAYLDNTDIAQYVMDHHERTDGSGYPRGIKEEEISVGGQILSVSELSVSLVENPGQYSYKSKIQAILKFNSEGYSKEASNKLLNLTASLKEDKKMDLESVDREKFIKKLTLLWTSINRFKGAQNNSASIFLTEQLYTLKHNLVMSGINEELINLDDDDIDEILHESEEIHAIINEASYKLKNIIRELKRRWLNKIEFDINYREIAQWLNRRESVKKENNNTEENT